MNVLAFLILLLNNTLFVVDASSEASYAVEVSHGILRKYVDDVGLLSRNMPGVVSIQELDNGTYLYQTEKAIPLSKPLRTTFTIRKTLVGDSLTIYRSADIQDDNFMSCKVRLLAEGESRTLITISLRVRLSRRTPSDVHWLAPVLGEDFISGKMRDDLDEMLREFVERSRDELNKGVVIPTASK